ncbi:MAG: hypothetical protein COB60_08065 [Flavobacteriaceae bacterium]|nr:MAG: hypothetical protein COB60_08065 [Flavobacteriaceae bacterium]
MKNIITKLFSLLIILIVVGCSNDDQKEISGTFEFSEIGIHNFKINASNIKATITIVGAGGGGGGGVGFNAGNSSTGGGGGGGAGEVKLLIDIDLQENVNYTVNIGEGGNGGNVNGNGLDGQLSEISLEQITLFMAIHGNGGKSNTINENVGGTGGIGFPQGSAGGNGELLDVNWNGIAGTGGIGGDNFSTFGIGGNGGIGTEVNNLVPTSAQPGIKGGNGYVKIEWSGIK